MLCRVPFCVFNKEASVAQLDGSHELQVLGDPQKPEIFACVDALLLMQCATRQDGRPVTETDAIKLSTLENKVTRIVRRDSSFVVLAKSELNLRAAFEKELNVSFFKVWVVVILEGMVLFDFLTGNGSETYQCYRKNATFFSNALVCSIPLRSSMGRSR